MARDPHSTKKAPGNAGVWFARIRTGTVRRTADQATQRIDPLLQQRLSETADAAAEAADKAARAAQAARHAVGLSDLLEAFGPQEGTSPDELVEAAKQAIETALEAREGGAKAANQGHLAKLAAQDEASEAAPELDRDAGLGELWHR